MDLISEYNGLKKTPKKLFIPWRDTSKKNKWNKKIVQLKKDPQASISENVVPFFIFSVCLFYFSIHDNQHHGLSAMHVSTVRSASNVIATVLLLMDANLCGG